MKLRNKAYKNLNFHRYSIKKWKKILNNDELTEQPFVKTAAQMLTDYPFLKIKDFFCVVKGIDPKVAKGVEIELKYQKYIAKSMKEIEKLRKGDQLADISDVPYEEYQAQFTEQEYEKLIKQRPKTLFDASRISGIRPTTLLYISYLYKKHEQMKEKEFEEKLILNPSK